MPGLSDSCVCPSCTWNNTNLHTCTRTLWILCHRPIHEHTNIQMTNSVIWPKSFLPPNQEQKAFIAPSSHCTDVLYLIFIFSFPAFYLCFVFPLAFSPHAYSTRYHNMFFVNCSSLTANFVPTHSLCIYSKTSYCISDSYFTFSLVKIPIIKLCCFNLVD